jgi:N-glycosylase/DNA lyase
MRSSALTTLCSLVVPYLSSNSRRTLAKGGIQALYMSEETPAKKRRLSVLEAPCTPDLLSSPDASVTASSLFVDLGVSRAQLRPSATLTTGQCFHWKAIEQNNEDSNSAWGSHNATEWIGTVRVNGDSIVLVIKETPSSTLYRVLEAPPDLDIDAVLYSYFQLDIDMQELYQTWSRQCERLEKIAKCIPGVRIVQQDPWECLVSFICSSNNNIPRITKILAAIRREYGDFLVEYNQEVLYSFPSLEQLSQATEADLKSKCGLGYRAKYIVETTKLLTKLGGEAYLRQLQSMDDHQVVQDKLVEFCGVGRKVADCVALFSLNSTDAIPVDTHVWKIAKRDYDRDLPSIKSLTPTVYKQVGDLFRHRFPVRAGWAHSLLFVAELPSFRPALTDELIAEMDKFRQEEQEKKKQAKLKKKD